MATRPWPVRTVRSDRFPLSLRPSVLCRLAAHRMWLVVEPFLTPLGISVVEYEILSMLSDSRLAHSQDAMVDMVSVDRAHFMEGVVDLLDRGLLQRSIDNSDAITLQISESGLLVLDTATAVALENGAHLKVFAGFDAGEVQTTLRVLAKLAGLDERRKGVDSAKSCNVNRLVPSHT